jgi:hypothetical protein
VAVPETSAREEVCRAGEAYTAAMTRQKLA